MNRVPSVTILGMILSAALFLAGNSSAHAANSFLSSRASLAPPAYMPPKGEALQSAGTRTTIVVFLVTGAGDCCIPNALITSLKEIANQNNIDIVWAAQDARGQTTFGNSTSTSSYTSPWNDLDNYYAGGRGDELGDWAGEGTANFREEVIEYVGSLPGDYGLIFIGHSFGGDSILSLLQSYRPRQEILFVGVLDPVDWGGQRLTLTGNVVPRYVKTFFNRWQTNDPLANLFDMEFNFPLDFWIDGEIDCAADRCNQMENSIARHADGTALRVRCGELEVGSHCQGAEWRVEGTLECKPRKIKDAGDLFGSLDPRNLGGPVADCETPSVYYPGEKDKPLSHQSLPYDEFLNRELTSALEMAITNFLPPAPGSLRELIEEEFGDEADATSAQPTGDSAPEPSLTPSPTPSPVLSPEEELADLIELALREDDVSEAVRLHSEAVNMMAIEVPDSITGEICMQAAVGGQIERAEVVCQTTAAAALRSADVTTPFTDQTTAFYLTLLRHLPQFDRPELAPLQTRW